MIYGGWPLDFGGLQDGSREDSLMGLSDYLRGPLLFNYAQGCFANFRPSLPHDLLRGFCSGVGSSLRDRVLFSTLCTDGIEEGLF